MDTKLKLAAETLIFQSDQKFMYFVVKFNAKFQFWCKTRNVPKKIYAEIWPVEEITSLNSFYNINYNSGHGSTLKVCSWIFIQWVLLILNRTALYLFKKADIQTKSAEIWITWLHIHTHKIDYSQKKVGNVLISLKKEFKS